MSFHVPEKYRVRTGYMASSASNGNNVGNEGRASVPLD